MSAVETKGRIKVFTTTVLGDHYLVPELGAGPFTAFVALASNKPDAHRLAACWNACEGMSTEALEQPHSIQDRIASACGELYEVKAERDQLRAEVGRLTDVLLDEKIKLEEARAELAKVTHERNAVTIDYGTAVDSIAQLQGDVDAARALLNDVMLADGGYIEVDAGARYERIRALLAGKPAPVSMDLAEPTVDHPAVSNAKSIIENAAHALLQDVEDLGMVLTITQRSLHPYASGNYETVVEVRAARERA